MVTQLTLCDLWPQQSVTLWLWILSTKFGSLRAFLSNLSPGWPLRDPWPQQCTMLWSGVLLTKFGTFRKQIELWLTFAWPLTPAVSYALVWGLLPTKFGGHWAFLRQLDLWMTFDLCWGGFENMLSNLGVCPLPPCQVLAQYCEVWQNA